ncbi:MAG TPA: VOC family protein [Acidimicrobiales bacterium]|nr:VOC family protein [Acidimicrobiales bacterium]HLN43740.1 VOC family protein [Acidimicrobiales bacterium]
MSGGPLLGSSELVAFVATTDIDRAGAFYGGVLGLPLVEDGPSACVFDAHGTQLRVTPVAEIRTAPYTVLGWAVDDMVAAVQALVHAGVGFERFAGMEQDGLGAWAAPSGARVAWFTDPDGNVLSLTQASAPGNET